MSGVMIPLVAAPLTSWGWKQIERGHTYPKPWQAKKKPTNKQTIFVSPQNTILTHSGEIFKTVKWLIVWLIDWFIIIIMSIFCKKLRVKFLIEMSMMYLSCSQLKRFKTIPLQMSHVKFAKLMPSSNIYPFRIWHSIV